MINFILDGFVNEMKKIGFVKVADLIPAGIYEKSSDYHG